MCGPGWQGVVGCIFVGEEETGEYRVHGVSQVATVHHCAVVCDVHLVAEVLPVAVIPSPVAAYAATPASARPSMVSVFFVMCHQSPCVQ
jgi:hypothetical protein